ncbi:hypothetical protein [Paenibacillus polymyxa]|uniref:hypothetical protein n=1 Tax=Paenibacillus polymyxa TaxID=1406 RepID=UPI002AB532F1|nr:hypothetical protein [Paenibacillus polymyxa]MDY8022002.1 hypothetical protein [Paenibacillus polymyxa]
MIGFSTILPLSTETTTEEFLLICRDWMKHSPHTSLEINESSIKDGLKYTSHNESLEFVRVDGEKGIHSGVRHTKKDDDCEWRTDVLGYKTSDSFLVSIVTSKAEFNVKTYTKLPARPYIIKLLMEKTLPMFDDSLIIQKEPKKVDLTNYQEVVSLINNEKKNRFPIVFISKYFTGDYLINPIELGKWLSGFAHVYYEADEGVSQKIREITNGQNPYNGTIGIYWPGGGRNNYYSHDESDHLLKVRLFVQKTLSSRTLIKECRWSYIQDIKYRMRLAEYKKNNTELTDFMEYTLSEISILKERIDNLEAENDYLNHQFEIQTETEFTNVPTLMYKGTERELFRNEQLELIIEILEEKLNSGSCSDRMKNMINSILESNNKPENKEVFLESIKRILVSDKGLTKQNKKELKKLGFDITENGKHYKLKFQGDERYSFTISKSFSDFRAPKNNYSQFKEYFFSV